MFTRTVMNLAPTLVLMLVLTLGVLSGSTNIAAAQGVTPFNVAVAPEAVSTISLDLVDPNPSLLTNGAISNMLDNLALDNNLVVGAAADGVTQVLVRANVSGAGSVQFCLSGGTVAENGGLAQVGNTGRSTCVAAGATQISSGAYHSFAIYQVPDEFNRGSDQGKADRTIQLNATFTPTIGNLSSSATSFKLVRPPVVLVHGLWSEGSTWTFPLVTDSRFQVTLADYENTNASRFSTNDEVTSSFIQQALVTMRQDNIAVTQVDVVGHSMGGLISRLHPQSPDYKNSSNFNQGDINKLVTLNSPHGGSPLANLALDIRRSFWGRFVGRIASTAGVPIDEGAIDDLAIGSNALANIQQTEVPSHAILGTGGSDLFTSLGDLSRQGGPFGTLYTIVDWFYNVDLFGEEIHDGVVSLPSQQGGIAAGATTTFGGEAGLHTLANDRSEQSQKLIDLFNSAADGASFANFPSTSNIVMAASKLTISEQVSEGELHEGGIAIQLPVSAASVNSSQPLELTVATDSSLAVDGVLLVGPNVAMTNDSGPFKFDVNIPVDAVGAFPLTAIGRDADGNIFVSGSVELHVVPDAALEAVTLAPSNLVLVGSDSRSQLHTFGEYSDNIVRDIRKADAGTRYSTSDSQIATITADGMLMAHGTGTVTVTAQNGDMLDNIEVIILDANEDANDSALESNQFRFYLPIMQ